MLFFVSCKVCKLIWNKGTNIHPHILLALQGSCKASTEKCKLFQKSLNLRSTTNAIKIYLSYNQKKKKRKKKDSRINDLTLITFINFKSSPPYAMGENTLPSDKWGLPVVTVIYWNHRLCSYSEKICVFQVRWKCHLHYLRNTLKNHTTDRQKHIPAVMCLKGFGFISFHLNATVWYETASEFSGGTYSWFKIIKTDPLWQ